MSMATVKMDPDNLDDVTILIRGNSPALVFFKDRDSVLELCRLVMGAYFEDHPGSLIVDIDGKEYRFPRSVWRALYTELDQWFAAYLGYCKQLPEVIPLFPKRFSSDSES